MEDAGAVGEVGSVAGIRGYWAIGQARSTGRVGPQAGWTSWGGLKGTRLEEGGGGHKLGQGEWD